MDDKSRKGGALLVDVLSAEGVRTVFGVPGESYLAVLDALHDAAGCIRTVMARHEGAAAYMASAHGKLTGRPGICFVTRGPGATNAAVGVHTAMQDSSPMILFIGQANRETLGREAFQEIDYEKFFGSVSKWSVELRDSGRIPEVVGRAFRTALSGRPGPVIVALPEDMLEETVSAPPVAVRSMPVRPEAGADAVAHVLSMLEDSQRPLVLAGGGGWTCSGRDALQRFSEGNGIPVVAAFRRQDLIDNRSPAYAGDAGTVMPPHVKDLMTSADLVLAAGVRFDEITTGGYGLFSVPVPKQALIHVHSSDGELGKVYVPDLAVQACPCSFFCKMEDAVLENRGRWREWYRDAHRRYRESLRCPDTPGPVNLARIMSWLADRLPDDAVLTNGAGNFAIWPGRFIPLGRAARLLAPQSGSMGYGLPAAIAAKLAHPDRMVVCFAGDGDFQMTGQELATARQYGAAPIVILFNNGMYGTIRMHQERQYPGRVHGTDLVNPDFAALARAYGFHAERVVRTDEFENAFERAVGAGTGALIELRVDPEAVSPYDTLAGIRSRAAAPSRDDAA